MPSLGKKRMLGVGTREKLWCVCEKERERARERETLKGNLEIPSAYAVRLARDPFPSTPSFLLSPFSFSFAPSVTSFCFFCHSAYTRVSLFYSDQQPPVSPHRTRETKLARTLTSFDGVWAVEALKGFPSEDAARQLLERVAASVSAVMKQKRWKLVKLEEMYPDQQNLLGLNTNGGERIQLRLRHANDRASFFSFDTVKSTMVHELAHNIRGPHDDLFYKAQADLWRLMESTGHGRDAAAPNATKEVGVWVSGGAGSWAGPTDGGHRMGGCAPAKKFRTAESERDERVAAALRRFANAARSGPPQRLGGGEEAGVLSASDLQARVANAAAMRAARALQDASVCGSGGEGGGATESSEVVASASGGAGASTVANASSGVSAGEGAGMGASSGVGAQFGARADIDRAAGGSRAPPPSDSIIVINDDDDGDGDGDIIYIGGDNGGPSIPRHRACTACTYAGAPVVMDDILLCEVCLTPHF